MATTLELKIAAPIPVGHRVELTWRQEPEPAGWTGSKIKGGEPRPSKPVVRDLDTGIVYGPVDHFLPKTTGYSFSEPRPLLAEPLPQLEVTNTLTGKIVACRVLTDGPFPGTSSVGVSFIQTTLVVAED